MHGYINNHKQYNLHYKRKFKKGKRFLGDLNRHLISKLIDSFKKFQSDQNKSEMLKFYLDLMGRLFHIWFLLFFGCSLNRTETISFGQINF